jgi:ABC-type nitrate/sulfonate/bicarbonate transport system substrate-binding protein
MSIRRITRRQVLERVGKGGLSLLTLSISARALGVSAWAETPKIIIGSQPINPLLSSYLGDVDPFREEGLSVEITRFQAGPAIIQAMTAGNVVVADTGIVPAMVAAARGLPVYLPYLGSFGTPDRPIERIMVRADSPIRSLDDLKGKKLAILGRGTVPELMLGALAKKSSIRKEDLELVLIPPPNQPAALEQGLVDAIFAIPPTDTVAERQYKARTIANSPDLVPYLGPGAVVVRRDFADANPEVTKKIFKAWIRLARWIGDNEAAARRAAGKTLNLPEDLAAEMRMPRFARNGMPVMPNVWHVYEMLVAAKTIDPHPDPEKLINDTVIEPAKRFVLPALAALGEERDAPIEAMLKGDYPLLPKPAASYYADWERRIVKG